MWFLVLCIAARLSRRAVPALCATYVRVPRTRGRQLATFTGGEIRVAAAATPDPLPLLRHEGSLGDEDQVLGCPVETDPLLFYLFI